MMDIIAFSAQAIRDFTAIVLLIGILGMTIKHMTNTDKHLGHQTYVSDDVFDVCTKNIEKTMDEQSESMTRLHQRIDSMEAKRADDTQKILLAINNRD